MSDNDIKTIKIAGLLLAVSFVFFLINKIVILSNNGDSKKQLETLAVNVGGTYYENILYENYKGNTNFFENIEDKGLTIDLNTAIVEIGYYSEKFINKKTGEKCDLKKSNFKIYPYKPYGKKDYRIEPNLSCGYGGN